ncbi:MAG: replication initiation protein [Lamprobacter sp.]|uniref:replication initiation protein n=1 Tax=Lamprobacter sp. TaxID=3100796 RepID=UPI002B261C6E|nr:replication initiation protein [Lamprobacter sp.]MEA3643315.1 replication initiation protein [Lamprobacter sp.]
MDIAEEQQAQVYKSNALVEASYRLSVAEQRIVLACNAQVRHDQQITDELLYSITATEFANLSGTSSKQAYRELEQAAMRLSRREVWLVERPNGNGAHEETLVTRWVQSVRYVRKSGCIRLRFSRDMLPYLSQLTEQFTRYALGDVARMTSAHAIRLYELLAQWREKGSREVEIDWFRKALQIEDRYPAIKDLKKRVLEPAIEQINTYSPLRVRWSQRKTGRRVTHLIFDFQFHEDAAPKPKRLAQRRYDSGELIGGVPREANERHARIGESYAQAASRLRQARDNGTLSW